MANKSQNNTGQLDLFNDWLIVEPAAVGQPQAVLEPVSEPVPEPLPAITAAPTFDEFRHRLAMELAAKLGQDGEITSAFLTQTANRVFGGTQADGTYSPKDAYDAMEAAFNIHLLATEPADWIVNGAEWAQAKVAELTQRIQRLPTQTRRDPEMDEWQQFSTPPALAFVANWVAAIRPDDRMMEPSAGTGDLAIWSHIAGADVVLNELAPRRQALLAQLFPDATLFRENAEQLDNVLPADTIPTVIVMNPPFSSTAGRVQGQRSNANGAKHIEQALRRLADGGRLVAIVGQGMAADRPAFRAWWYQIEAKYTVRANIGIDGREYAKYGTSFDNIILVIDKTGPTIQPVLTGRVATVAELPALLENIRNERKPLQRGPVESTGRDDSHTVQDSIRSEQGTGGAGTDSRSARTESIGDADDSRAVAADSEAVGESVSGNESDDGIGARSDVRDNVTGEPGGSGGGDLGGAGSVIEISGTGGIAVEATKTIAGEFTDSVFACYTPQRLSISDAHAHPGKLVQSAAMSAVEPPAPTYTPALPARLVRQGLLSIAQLESIVYAGQAHSELLPNGSRKGFFIGDGTGVGKGREISGIILDNLVQGRKKAVWVSFNEGLINDARRDYSSIGGDPDRIFFQGKTKAGNELTQTDGILFTTYSTLRGGEKKQATDLGQSGGKSRLQQMVEWLGKDFDGVIAFDEAHSMGNAIAIKGKRGVRKPSQQAMAGINLQRELPNARVVYVSATGATEVSNLSYTDRLGLWGEGTPFADVNAFVNGVSAGGIASMELISRDMKAMGMYLARSLSYDGVSYERMEHTLSELQEDIYNELAGAWQIVLNNVEKALEITQTGKSGPGKSAALAQFWGAHQRFFNQIITAMQTPAVIEHIQQQLDAGNAAVIQIVNTNEAAQERIIADAMANDADLEDLDFTPRQMLMDYVRNGFPVAAYEESVDSNGNKIYVPVRDSEGNQVFDREAIALRDQLLSNLQHIRVPENPLDSIINAFGPDVVAEVTGRGRRFVQVRDDGNLKVVEEKRGKNSSRVDAELFQADKKKILVFSGAGGTGYSFHADNTAVNTRKRVHYILQPGWRADAAVQGFGRTHRTNQATEPHYVLPTTNLKAQKRFVSSIARRLDQLGALTRGQRQATSQGMFTAADNLESEYAKTALYTFFSDLYQNRTGLSFQNVTREMGLNLLNSDGGFEQSKIPDIPQFLNRLLSLKTDQQNAVFEEFESRLVEAVEYAKQHGLYDEGLQTLRALNIKKTRDEIAYEDAKTGAQTRYVELAVTNALHYIEWGEIAAMAHHRQQSGKLSGWFVSEHGRNKGEVFFMDDRGERMNSEGELTRRGTIYGIKKNGHRYIDNADVIHRGWEYRFANGSSTKVTLTRQIDESEAERLWKAQLEAAPKTETTTTSMLVGVILPIWDRVEGSETIYRLQTDDGEQLLGRLLGPNAAKQTLKNLGLDSATAKMSTADLFAAIQAGQRAVLSNGWEISLATVNREERVEVKGRLSDAEKRVLTQQGAFVERINWQERVFIPAGDIGLPVFERITASKPVVDLFHKKDRDIADPDKGVGVELSVRLPEPGAQPFNDSIKLGESGRDQSSPSTKQQDGTPMADKTSDKKSFAQVVADKLITQLEQGSAPWQRPWESAPPGSTFPMNPTTGKRYRGINAIYLMSQEYSDQRWMTYKQAAAVGAQVRKGERGTPVQYWKFSEQQPKHDENGRPVLDVDGKPETVTVKLERPRVFFATVFNAEQIDSLPPLEKKTQEWDALERAEIILKASGADIRHSLQDRAFYRQSTDSIHLPDRGQFESADRYYATALHELGHWTGHENRLGRDLSHPFGSEGYAKEELRAEIASLMLGDELGIGHDPGQHAAYVGSWIKALQDDPMEIFRAAADAEKIHEFVLGFEQKQIQENDQQQAIDQRPPHELTLAQFASLAMVEELTNHSRKWNVSHGDYSAFSDVATAQEAIADVHHAAVNNALYMNTPEGRTSILSSTFPPASVLAEYPDLVAKFPDATPTPKQEPLTVSALTAEQYKAMKAADDTYQRELVRVYGEKNAGDARYQSTHDDPDVQAAANALRMASEVWRSAVADARRTLAEATRTDNKMEAPMNDKPNASWKLAGDLEPGDAIVSTIPGHAAFVDRVDEVSVTNDNRIKVQVNNFTATQYYGLDEQVRVSPALYRRNQQSPQEAATQEPLAPNAAVTVIYTVNSTDNRDKTVETENPQEAARAFLDIPGSERPYVIRTLKRADGRESADTIASTWSKDDGGQKEFFKSWGDSPDQALKQALDSEAQKRANTSTAAQPQDAASKKGELTYINVPFREKNDAKALGARWDRQKQSWYVPRNLDLAPFAKWTQGAPNGSTADPVASQDVQERLYLAVPYAERLEAKAAGALWDKGAKSWYAGPSGDMGKLQKWLPDNVAAQQGPAMTPIEEFAEALRAIGCVVTGEHPNMDGKRHRIEVEGDKGEKSGFYVAHLDGHPAGYLKNNRTGVEMKWKSKGYTLNQEEKARLQAEAAAKLQRREAEQEARRAVVTEAIRDLLTIAPVAQPDHTYLKNKQARPDGLQVVPNDAIGLPDDSIILIGKNWRESKELREQNPDKLVFTAGDLLLPAQDIHGQVVSVQSIQTNGAKRFAKDSAKIETFHVVGGEGLAALDAAPVLIISEGYATADTLSQSMDLPVVSAFDSGNLPHVAKLLRERFPDKLIIIAGDDDLSVMREYGNNPGREKAEEAAKAVNGHVVFPIFAPGEQSENPKSFSDFNDLAVKSSLGADAVKRQVRAVVDTVVANHRRAEQAERQELGQAQEHEQRRAMRR